MAYYARNEGLGFSIPYHYEQISHIYEPDFLVRLTDGRTVVLEIKGQETDRDQAKYQADRRWCSAVTNWGKLGQWVFHVCRNPQAVGGELAYLASGHRQAE